MPEEPLRQKLSRVAVGNLDNSIGNPLYPRLLAALERAAPRGVINLGSGTPDLPTPPHVVEYVHSRLKGGEVYYTPYQGIQELREAVSGKLLAENGLHVPPEQIVVTNGAQESIQVVCASLINPGDEVIMTDPGYSAYKSIVRFYGGVVRELPLRPDQAWRWDLEQLEALITPRTKLLIAVTPDNPTGAMLGTETLEGLRRLALEHDLLIVSDELYEHFSYGAVHASLAGLPGMQGRVITVNGFSKSFGMTGWRVGYLALPAWMVQVATEAKHMLSICTALPSQYAALSALSGPQEPWAAQRAEYARRREVLISRLGEMKLPVLFSQGSYYLMADVRASGLSSMDFSAELIEEHAVRVGPGVVFGSQAEGLVRLSLMTPEPQMSLALDRLQTFWQQRTQ
ncbi:pyridoxal phosphate-dependent aminotransferase [Deinococcus sp. UYEF24]